MAGPNIEPRTSCSGVRLRYAARLFQIDRIQFHYLFQIDRIQNKALYQQYVAKKELMTKQTPNPPAQFPIERTVWHGTSHAAVSSIQMHGFNRSYAGDKNGDYNLLHNYLLKKSLNIFGAVAFYEKAPNAFVEL